MNNSERILWVDYAKFIGIFLVVLGHASVDESLRSFIYVFHIPLFFFISGLFFSFEKYPDWKVFVRKRFFQLIVPYLFFSCITYVFWFCIGRKVGQDATLHLNVYKPLIGILWGNLNDHYLEHCPPLWFLTCLFSVEMIYYFIFKKIKPFYAILICIVIITLLGWMDYKFQIPRLPWGINMALSMIFFYGLGSQSQKLLLQGGSGKRSYRLYIGVSIVGLFLIYIVSKLNGKIEVSMRDFGNYFYFIMGGSIGIITTIAISKLLVKIFGTKNIILFVGKNTLIVFATHLIAASFIKAIFYYILKLDVNFYQQTLLLTSMFSIASIIILIPAMLFINKYLPFAVGKQRKKQHA